jgi:hypothetical protein
MENPRFLKSRGEVFIDKQLNDAAKAIEKENLKNLSEIVEKGLDVNSVGEHGFNLLYWALKFDSLKSFEGFLLLGAEPKGYSSTYWSASLDTDKYLKLTLK